jgi:minor histocompatibility antigen H13
LFALSFFNNLLASGIALQTIGTVKVESFAVACALLSGLFFYDIYWVFFSEVMMTVATKVDAPIKFLFPASIESMPGRPYPFSVLGLGDIVVPGIMAALARKIDVEGLPSIEPFVVPSVSDMIEDKNQGRAATVWPNFFNTRDFLIARFAKKEDAIQPEPVIPIRELRRQQGKVSYLSYITVGYTLGLGGAFTANEISRSGQPALLYLVPLSILAMLAAAYKNDEVKELWGEGISVADKTPKIEQLE